MGKSSSDDAPLGEKWYGDASEEEGAARVGNGIGSITNHVWQWDEPLKEYQAVYRDAKECMKYATLFTAWYFGTREDLAGDDNLGANQHVTPAFSP